MAKLKATPKNFAEAQQVLGTKSSVRLGNNTYLERVEEDDSFNLKIVVRLHNTHIVQFHSDGRTTLHTDGYRTVTTKERINHFVNGRVYQKNNQWFYAPRVYFEIAWGNAVSFVEGLDVGENFRITVKGDKDDLQTA